MSILNRYILKEFALSFVAVMSFCSLLIVVALIFDKFDRIYENSVSGWNVLMYFAYELPFQLKQLAPIVCPLTVLFAIGGLARGNETFAMMTNGVSSLRIALPILVAGVLISALLFAAGETFIPQWKKQAMYIDKRFFHNKSEDDVQTDEDVFVRGHDNRVYIMPLYNVRGKEMINPQIQTNKEDYSGGIERVVAQTGKQISKDDNSSVWRFTQFARWRYNQNGQLEKYETFPTYDLTLERNLDEILTLEQDPDEMNYRDLNAYIMQMRERGHAADNYLTDLYQKIMFPFGVVLTMIIAFSFAIRARSGSVINAFGPAVAWSLAYFGVHAVFRAFGQAGMLNPFVAAAAANTIYLVAAAYYFRKSYRWYN